MNLFGLFKKQEPMNRSCKNCEHYSEYFQPDKLNKDKTVTPGRLMAMSCRRMDEFLTDTAPCPLYEERTGYKSFGHTMRLLMKKKGPPKEGGEGNAGKG